MRIAAIDIGTNTAQLVVADVGLDAFAVVTEEERFARLGQGVDAARRLAPEAMARAMRCLAESRATAERLGADRTVIGATSASRDAANVGELQAQVREALGLDYRVLSGPEEARLSFHGALALTPVADDAPVVVLDIGGGSTEIVVGTRAAGIGARVSLDVGSVRLTERHLGVRPATAPALDAARADVADALAAVPAPIRGAAAAGAPVLATGSVARILARLAGTQEGPGGLRVVALPAIRAQAARLAALTPAETLAGDPSLAGREDVIAAAVLVVAEVLGGLGAPAYTPSAGGLRHGLALQAAGRLDGPAPVGLAEARPLVAAAGLPTSDLDASPARWLGVWRDGALAGVVATEPYGAEAVLRSLAVGAAARGAGLGAALVAAAEAQARRLGARRLALLTTTAAPFFERLGYAPAERAALSDPVRASSQFAGTCPDSAACLAKAL